MTGGLAIVIGLIALQALTGRELPALGPALDYPAQLVARWMDPAQPLITPRSSSTTSTTSTTNASDQLGQATAGVKPPPQHLRHHSGG